MNRIIKPESLHLQAYNIIKKGILEGNYQPSERMIEAKMADQLGISRGPVREAFRMLSQDGLLTYNDGFVRVYQPAVQDVVEIFQCRESLETLAISLAITNISHEEMEQLSNNLTETAIASDHNSGIELGKLDQQFHDIIINASKNKQLIELLEVIRTKIHYMRNSMVNGEFYPSFVEEHERIYRLLLERNGAEAVKIMKVHIKKGLDGVLQHINS
ncbi:GntR family transcriptional regulator [Virgibacillus oceani]|uniref:GntR family transcriptional regulator n=1 Tax=Virgibacillus oceani TaxID=1479511 RepID=A0A917HSU6_9BACI|nr:GntR family transcriptional regulator [Virgibacillus oceani]GGG88181.1 GntR family transcriptional regulator [Virgibacillus oceani]